MDLRRESGHNDHFLLEQVHTEIQILSDRKHHRHQQIDYVFALRTHNIHDDLEQIDPAVTLVVMQLVDLFVRQVYEMDVRALRVLKRAPRVHPARRVITEELAGENRAEQRMFYWRDTTPETNLTSRAGSQHHHEQRVAVTLQHAHFHVHGKQPHQGPPPRQVVSAHGRL